MKTFVANGEYYAVMHAFELYRYIKLYAVTIKCCFTFLLRPSGKKDTGKASRPQKENFLEI
jgi:hypothetical protein